jgi:LPS-assembly protein
MKFFKNILLIFILTVPLCVYSKQLDYKTSFTNPVDISAFILEHDREQNVYTAKGKVDLKEGTRILNADYVRYDENTKDILAEGNVVFQDEGDIVECEKLYLNLITKKGTIEKGRIFIKKGNFHISGEQIEKVGDATYNMINGEFTTCGWEKPAWKFSARDVKITVEGYAKTKGTKFHILDYPVFYLPWGMFPVKTERQSGLLIPELITSSRDGIKIKNSYFWAISKDKDATLYAQYIENRGFRLGSEFRYALREDLKGVWDFSIIPDKDYDNTRYELKGKHEQVFKDDLTLKLNLDYVSDMDYIKDFAPTTSERSEELIKSTMYVEKPFKKSLLTYEAAYFRSLLVKNNDSTFQYFPYITYFTEYIPILKDKFYTDLSSHFINFYREEGSTYSRFSLEPKLRFPYSWKGVNFLVNSTFYETAYLINRSDTEDKGTKRRETFKIEGDMNVQLLRSYNTEMLNLGEMQSLIKPQLKYTFIPNTSFRDIPDIDPYDRIYKTNTITYSFNHYLNAFSEKGSKELSLLEIEQTYSFSGKLNPSELYKGYGDRLSDINARLTLFPKDELSIVHQSSFNTHGDGFTTMSNSINHRLPNIYYLDIAHSYTKDLNNELYFNLGGGTYKHIDGRYQIRYSFKDSMWIDTLYQLTYHPACWAITLTMTQTKRPRDTSIKISFDLTGLTSR